VLSEGKWLERGIIIYNLPPAVIEDRDLDLVIVIKVALHVQHNDYSLASFPYCSSISVSLDFFHDLFN
jgi:hypothetical protein